MQPSDHSEQMWSEMTETANQEESKFAFRVQKKKTKCHKVSIDNGEKAVASENEYGDTSAEMKFNTGKHCDPSVGGVQLLLLPGSGIDLYVKRKDGKEN